MTRIKACYIKEGQAYVERNLSEIHIEGTKVREYPDRCFLNFSGYLIEVSLEEQKEFFQEKDRKSYIRRGYKSGMRTVPLDTVITAELYGHGIHLDPINYENACIDKVMGEIVMRIVEELPPDEYDLIINIYIKGVSEREFARKIGIPQTTLNDRKLRILSRLRKKIEK